MAPWPTFRPGGVRVTQGLASLTVVLPLLDDGVAHSIIEVADGLLAVPRVRAS